MKYNDPAQTDDGSAFVSFIDRHNACGHLHPSGRRCRVVSAKPCLRLHFHRNFKGVFRWSDIPGDERLDFAPYDPTGKRWGPMERVEWKRDPTMVLRAIVVRVRDAIGRAFV